MTGPSGWFPITVFSLVLALLGPALAAETPLMSKEELRTMLDDPGLVLIDVRPEDQWQLSPNKLPEASHEDPFSADQWGGKYKDFETVVLYCA